MPAHRAWQRLVGAVQKLSSAHDLSSIMSIVRTAARDLTGADGATFVLREGSECHYADEDAIAPLWKGHRFPSSACVSGWVMLHRRAAAIADVFADPRIAAAAYRPTFVKSMAMVPIRADKPLGAIGIYWAEPHCPTELELDILKALADTTSLAIANVELLQTLDQKVKAETRLLETANREMEAFSYSVSHDLRSPLTAIKGYAEIVADEYAPLLGSEGRQLLEYIDQEVERMRELIDSLLALGRLTQAEMQVGPLDLGPMVMEIAGRLHAAEPDRDSDFRVAADLTVEADAALMRIVLENLLSNAWKYSSRRDTAVIEVGKVAGSPVMIFVRDNGAGFDAGKSTQLFYPFQRLHSESDFPGIGVGLATVKRIIARHGRSIWGDSLPGQGATFCFTLPGAAAAPPLRLAA